MLDFALDGAELASGAGSNLVEPLRNALAPLAVDGPGARIIKSDGLADALSGASSIAALARARLGPRAKPVRAILLDKSAGSNWGVGWHQDRTIAVKARVEVEGYGPWSIKRGMQHVAPPVEILAAMITLRIHLDDVPDDNAPLVVALGTHRLGRIAEPAVPQIVADHRHLVCHAKAGDVWIYCTPILHMSRPARQPARRRVLQVDYSATPLSGGLVWAGI